MKMIFVVGCGHSGTSLMIRLLGNHRDVYAVPGETEIFYKKQKIITDHVDAWSKKAEENGKICFVEKTPRNVHKIEKICAMYPESKIIAMVRDPRDVASSLKARGYTFYSGIRRWIKDNRALSNGKVDRNRIMFVKLEDITACPNDAVGKILNFVELNNQDLTNYYEHKKEWYSNKVVSKKPNSAKGSNHLSLRNWQINQSIFETTKRYDKDMSNFDHVIFLLFKRRIRKILHKLDIIHCYDEI